MKNIIIIFCSCLCLLAFSCKKEENNELPQTIKQEPVKQPVSSLNKYGLKIISVIERPGDSYTQGILLKDGAFYESGGLTGQSALHKIDAKTGAVLKTQKLEEQYFAEGLDLFKGKLYQITWRNNICFVYDFKTFKQEKTFSYYGEGWGLTNDGENLIMSDGTNILRIINPVNFTLVKTIPVYTPEGSAVTMLNELEYVDGKVYANIWQKDEIAIIDYKTGKQTGLIDLSILRGKMKDDQNAEVSNGIAYNPKSKTFYLTGKFWNKIFEVELVEDKQ